MLMKGEAWKDKEPNATLQARVAQERSVRRAVKRAADLCAIN